MSVPIKGDSSAPPSDLDTPTVVDFPKASSDPEATLVDPDATFVDAGPVGGLPPPSPDPVRKPARMQVSGPLLQAGDVLGGRYEILQLLGEGGMGAVYKARDRELDRPVALKLIRPELASNPSILARFKQELLLSRQVTHKNVIRIYDLGDADGVKFITMEFVEGRDLRALIQEKKEVFSGRSGGDHAAGVPGAGSRARRGRDSPRPEAAEHHARGQRPDSGHGLRPGAHRGRRRHDAGRRPGRHDGVHVAGAGAGQGSGSAFRLFTAGLILYELLTGKMPFRADSALASLIKRTQERAVPISEHDSTLPGALTAIVNKCLERDPAVALPERNRNAARSGRVAGQSRRGDAGLSSDVKPWGQTIPWPLLMGIVTVLLLAIVGYVFRGKLFSPAAEKSGPALSLAVMPFQNAPAIRRGTGWGRAWPTC